MSSPRLRRVTNATSSPEHADANGAVVSHASLSLTRDRRKISYAQGGEDIVLLRAFAGQPTGFWIDVGANHPERDSVTRNFTSLGWRGVNVEPVESLFLELVAARPADINLHAAVGAVSGRLVFHRNDTNLDLSSFDEALIDFYRSRGDVITDIEVTVHTLTEICEMTGVSEPIDFVKIDTEGHELSVLQGHDFSRFPIRVLLAEVQAQDRSVVRNLLSDAGMTFVLFDGLNSWFVRNEELETLGQVLGSPAHAILDWYHPAVYVEMMRESESRIEDLLGQIEALRDDNARLSAGSPAESAPPRPRRWTLRGHGLAFWRR